MQTATRASKLVQFAATMLLGLVVAVGLAFINGAPEAAWLEFAVAAMYPETPRGRSCLAPFARRTAA